MPDTSASNQNKLKALIILIIIVVLAYSGGKIVGKKIAENQNAAQVAQEE